MLYPLNTRETSGFHQLDLRNIASKLKMISVQSQQQLYFGSCCVVNQSFQENSLPESPKYLTQFYGCFISYLEIPNRKYRTPARPVK